MTKYEFLEKARKKHGYKYIEGNEQFWDRNRPIAWSKIPFLLHILNISKNIHYGSGLRIYYYNCLKNSYKNKLKKTTKM